MRITSLPSFQGPTLNSIVHQGRSGFKGRAHIAGDVYKKRHNQGLRNRRVCRGSSSPGTLAWWSWPSAKPSWK